MLVFIFGLFFPDVLAKGAKSEAIVQLESGTLHGIRETVNGISVDSYYGIPYAKPPVGELRFQATEKEDPWEGVLEASVRRPLCAQAMNCTGCEGYEISEDCLYLDVFGPSDTDQKLPVYVWIHGGSFTKDWNPTWYNGVQQVAHGNFITVVVNYRLAAFGFLSTSDDVIPGNFAMLDQQRAFDWIHENIHEFGGDCSKITIHGQSAGGIMVKYHSISPMSGTKENPKFANVIVHSGQQMAWNENPTETASNLARRVGCRTQFNQGSKQFLDCVQAVSMDDIIEAMDKERVAAFVWTPVIDKQFLLEAPTREYMNRPGLTDRFNFMITTVNGEISMGAAGIRNENAFRLFMKPILGALLPVDVEDEGFWTDLETFYLPNGNIEMATADDWRTAYIMLGLDTGYAQYAYEFADTGRHTGAPFWKLNFRFDINNDLQEPCCRAEGEWREPWHGDDLLFYFGYVIQSGKGTPEEVELSKKMMKLLGQFGDSGSPDLSVIGEDFEWTQFNPDADALIIDKDSSFHMEPLWRTEALVFWKTHLFEKYPKPDAL